MAGQVTILEVDSATHRINGSNVTLPGAVRAFDTWEAAHAALADYDSDVYPTWTIFSLAVEA